MDAALKQRLVGAAVLVALAVIFLPMLVDGPEPERGTSAVPLDLPPVPARDFETRELPVAPSAGATSAVAPGTTETQAEATDDPARVVGIETEPLSRTDASPEEHSAAAPPVSPASSAPAATAPRNDTAPTPPPAASRPPPGGYVVNLGSYGNAANAQALVATLRSSGLSAYTDEVAIDGKPVLRVRLGPYAQRGEAEAARLTATRTRRDLAATVVALDADEAAAAPPPARAAVAAGFAVQIGALKSEADANALRQRARSAGFVTFVERVQTDAGPLWRVRVGPELQRANADKLKAQVLQKMQIEGMVVSHP